MMGESYFDDGFYMREWSHKDWAERRDLIADVWDSTDEKRCKELLAMLIAHSNEAMCDLSEQE